MANTMRWRYGDTNPVMVPVDAETSVEIGDLLYLDSNDAKPASDFPDQGATLATQQGFQDNFLGVAMQACSAGESANIRAATTGVFEFESDLSSYEPGTLVGPASNATMDGLESQKAVTVVSESTAIGRCVKQSGPGGGRVLVDVVSSVVKGGPQSRA